MKKVKLGEIASFSKGKQINGTDLVDGGKYEFLNGGINPSGKWNDFNVNENSIAISEGGNSCGFVNFMKNRFWCGAHCYYLYKVDGNTKYLYYNLKANEKKIQALRSGACMPNIKKNDLMNFEINYTNNIKEQEEIVTRLDKVQETIGIRKKQIDELDKLIKSQFVEIFGTARDTKFDTKTFVDIVKKDSNSIKRGPFGGSLKKEDFVNDGYLVYEQRHAIHNDFEYEKYYITEEKFKSMEMFKVEPKDLLISCSGVTLGRIAEVPENAKKGIINQALLKITLDSNIMNNLYFMHHFRSDEIQEILFGFSRGSGIPNFPSMSEVKKIKFVCPPIELQNQFADFVKLIDKQKIEMQKSLEEIQKLQESLMNKYFGG